MLFLKTYTDTPPLIAGVSHHFQEGTLPPMEAKVLPTLLPSNESLGLAEVIIGDTIYLVTDC